MNYPYKYCLIVNFDEAYSSGTSIFYYCDYAEADGDYNHFVDDGRECVLYRLLHFDNFDL